MTYGVVDSNDEIRNVSTTINVFLPVFEVAQYQGVKATRVDGYRAVLANQRHYKRTITAAPA